MAADEVLERIDRGARGKTTWYQSSAAGFGVDGEVCNCIDTSVGELYMESADIALLK